MSTTDETPTTPVVELRDVTVEFGSGWGASKRTITAMSEISFAIDEGETLGLVGESGSGKSTTGAVTLGLQRPDRGTVHFDGAPLTGSPRRRAGAIAAVGQHPQWTLNPRLRVGRSVAEPLTVTNRSRLGDHDDAVAAILDHVGLAPSLASRYPHELSGGQRQRVALARALVTRPRFVVFDEAVSALDLSVQAQILNLILDLQDEHGFAALFISHDLGAVRYVSHRIAVMRSGSIVELAGAEQLSTAPSHPYSRQLLEGLWPQRPTSTR
ncbi:MAG: ATP-binding cassette domain-containing protein [Actinomycetota bacterium]|nr:ATP-binding cassette domain-containing protein [Actinomycetota bacterium]